MYIAGQKITTKLLGNITIGKVFAEGGEGIIYEIEKHRNYLLKQYFPDIDPSKAKQLAVLKKNAYQVFAKINLAKNEELRCLPIEYVALKGDQPAYLMQRANGILLTDLLPNIRHISIHERLQIARALAHAVVRLHSSQIVHADIKPSNFIVEKRTAEWTVYVLDIDGGGYFGPQASHFLPSTTPSPQYQSPELIQSGWKKIWNQHSLRKQPDLWSLSVIIYQIIVDKDGPFPTRPSKSQIPNYEAYKNGDVINQGVTWPKPWQQQQMQKLGIDRILVDLFNQIFSNTHRLDIKCHPRPEVQYFRTYIDHVLQANPQNIMSRVSSLSDLSKKTVHKIPSSQNSKKRKLMNFVARFKKYIPWISVFLLAITIPTFSIQA